VLGRALQLDHLVTKSLGRPSGHTTRVKQLAMVAAALLVTALVAAGVTLGILQLQSRTNPQQVNLRSGVTIAEDSAVVQAAARARPAVV